MYTLKQSTALTLPFFAHDVNGDAVTGLTDGSFTKRLSKNGAAFGAMTVTITELENGWYSIPLSSGHSDTTGLLSVTFTNAGAKQVNLQFRVAANLKDDVVADIAALNDVAATDIVSAGAITTNAGAVSTVTTVGTTTNNADMRGTDNAALASVLGALADAAVGGDPTATDTVMQYVKQLVNVLVGTAGVVTYPAAAAPGNGVSLAEVLRAAYDDTADMQPKIGTPAADVSADIAAIKVDTGAILPAKNVAFSNLEFLMVLTSDHVSPATGLSITAQRSLDGGAFGAGTGTAAEVANGIYQYDASQADMNADIITFRFSSATADDTFMTLRTSG